MTLFLHYGAPDPQTGQNPNWKTFGYPGPISAPPQVEKPLQIRSSRRAPRRPSRPMSASSAPAPAAAVVAAVLAARGLEVVVLEAAGYLQRVRLHPARAPAYQEMYWRGGPHADR